MLKNNTPFDPAIDKKNQERSKGKNPGVTKDKSRRYQKFDSNAPVSRRQKKKREEQVKSQNATMGVEDGIKTPAPSLS